MIAGPVRRAVALLVPASLLLAAGADAGTRRPSSEPGPAPMRMWLRVTVALDQAAAERALRPPVPVKVRWQRKKLSSLDLGAPLLAMEALDVDGDGTEELVALTTREVVTLTARSKATFAIRSRSPLPGQPMAIRSRDPVGLLALGRRHGAEVLLARTSEQATGAVLAWRDGEFEAIESLAGFPVCDRGLAELQTGRNYFPAQAVIWAGGASMLLPDEFYGVECSGDLVDSQGRPIATTAVVSNEGVLTVDCRRGQEPCAPGPASGRRYETVGFAFAVDDVNNDGSPEVIFSGAVAPGDNDRVAVIARYRGEDRTVLTKAFTGGVVALVSGDIDGDGAVEVVAATRVLGSTMVGLWSLN